MHSLKMEDEVIVDGKVLHMQTNWDSQSNEVTLTFRIDGAFSVSGWQQARDELDQYLLASRGFAAQVKALIHDEGAPWRSGSVSDFESDGVGSSPTGAAN